MGALPRPLDRYASTNARRVITGAFAGARVVLERYPSSWNARDEMRDALRDG